MYQNSFFADTGNYFISTFYLNICINVLTKVSLDCYSEEINKEYRLTSKSKGGITCRTDADFSSIKVYWCIHMDFEVYNIENILLDVVEKK